MNERNAVQQQFHDAKLETLRVNKEEDVAIGGLRSDVVQANRNLKSQIAVVNRLRLRIGSVDAQLTQTTNTLALGSHKLEMEQT